MFPWADQLHVTLSLKCLNHDGQIEEAIKIIYAAKEAGANAVKLQTYRADTITLNSSKEDFRLPSQNPWESFNTLYSLYEKAYTPWEWHETLFNEAKKAGISIFSSPFDLTAVDLLEELSSPAYKIASPEITDILLIKKVAKNWKACYLLQLGLQIMMTLVLRSPP